MQSHQTGENYNGISKYMNEPNILIPDEHIDVERVRISAVPLTAKPITADQIVHRKKGTSQRLPSILFDAVGRSDLKPMTLTFPIDWSMDPFKDRNWCAQLHSWNMIDGCLTDFDDNRDPKDLDAAKALALDWHFFHCVEGKTGELSWGDKIGGHRATKIAYIISQWQHKAFPLTEDELSRMAELTCLHLDQLMNKMKVNYSNHSFYQLLGIRALADVIEPLDLREKICAFVNAKVTTLLDRQFHPSGMHKEHSFGYQEFGVATLKRLLRAKWFNDAELNALMDRVEAVLDWVRLPDGRIAPIGDTTGQSPKNVIETKLPLGTDVFDQAGYCIIRKNETGKVADASYFVLSGAFHSTIHRQPDDLSVYWFEGEEILSDPAKFAYSSDPRRGYAKATRAHSTIEIDRKNYSNTEQDAYGSAIKKVSRESWGFKVVGEVGHKKSGVLHSRTCLYAPGSWLLVFDQLRSEQKHKYTSWLQLAPQLERLTQHDGYLSVPLASEKVLRILHAGTATPTTTLHRGEDTPKLQGWISQSYGTFLPSYSIGTHQSGSNVSFASLLVLDGDDGSEMKFVDRKDLHARIRNSSGSTDLDIAFSKGEFSVVDAR